jgi:putative CocE/NonD family hydrolase
MSASSRPFLLGLLLLVGTAAAGAEPVAPLPDWVTYPGAQWTRITPEQAGLDAKKLKQLFVANDPSQLPGPGGWGGVKIEDHQWGAVLTRGGYLVHAWGDPDFRFQSASLGKSLTRVLVGLSAEAGKIKLDEPIARTWTGREQLSHPHKYLDAGFHRNLTWRQLLNHQGGFVLESGWHWRKKDLFHARIPDSVKYTGDPLFDNYAHWGPGTVTNYSSGGYWRLGQALTVAWDDDLKNVLQTRLFDHLGIPPERWEWCSGKTVHDQRDFYPDFPNYGEYIDPPYEINGHVVRGAPGWFLIGAADLARFGHLVATRGMWRGKRLIGAEWLQGHAGLDVHVVAGDPASLVSIAKINTKRFPFGQEVGTQGRFQFPPDLITGPVDLSRGGTPLRTPSEPRYKVTVERNVRIPMRDGVTLAAEVHRPVSAEQFPALMQLRYYQTGADQAQYFARRGYAAVLVDCRGRGGSDGAWDPYVHDPQDGHDAQQWIGRQPWCTGKIGTFGQSYNAFTQLMPAPLASPHLTCLFPVEGQQTNFGHLYNDGVLQLNVVFTFGLFATGKTQTGPHIPIGSHYLQLPLMSAADKVDNPQAQRIKTWMQHARYDEYWKAYGIKDKYHLIRAPAYFATGWYDNLVHENWRNFLGFRQQGATPAVREGTKISVGAGVHGAAGASNEMHLRWYDYWLKGVENGIDREPPIRIYVMGTGRWRDEQEWPLARTQFTKYYLHSGGQANSARGDGRLTTTAPAGEEPPDRFVYDPRSPVPTLGGQMSTHVNLWGPQDRQSVQQRADVLVYTTEPLVDDIEVTGPIELVLHAASTAVDTDFTATLTDVHPDGRAIHIAEGILGVTFGESLEKPTPIEPGTVYPFRISLWETSMVFRKGHRLRLEVSSSNFPRYARNQNTGLPLGTSAELKTATQTIQHNPQHPSHLVLPVIPIEKPKPIAPAADGSFTLRADQAAIAGPSLKLAEKAGILGWWTSDQDRAAWRITVPQPGDFDVELDFACQDDSAGNRFSLTCGPAVLTAPVPGTGTWYDLRRQVFGRIRLEAGVHDVVLQSAGPLRHALLDLRTVRLTPNPASTPPVMR